MTGPDRVNVSHADVEAAQDDTRTRDETYRRVQAMREAQRAAARGETAPQAPPAAPVRPVTPKKAQTPTPAAQKAVERKPVGPVLEPGSVVLTPAEAQAVLHLIESHPQMHRHPPKTDQRF